MMESGDVRRWSEEETVLWATLERLPTYDRLRKGIVTGPAQVDVSSLGFAERKCLFERLLSVVEEDNESFLLKVKERLNRVGIDLPDIEVRFENLNVEAQAHVGGRALPSFLNFYVGMVEDFLSYLHILPNKKKPFTILNEVSGIIKPSRMTLLLGPPSSGKTTLLLALTGRLDPNLKTSGNVTYNGHGMNEFIPQRTAAYVSQHDLHIAEMTVRETLEFSARCQGVGSRYDMLAELSRREKASNIKPDPDLDIIMKAATTDGHEASVMTDYILKVLGLEGCADTMVGNEMLRGISGGQRKRVTAGEILVGPAKGLFMDEISTGLDSSTTYQVVKSLKQYIQILNETSVTSLLQPAPETYDLFDDIILLSEGQIVYQGPREYVLDFFESMGFKCPERKCIADFLQEVTSRKDQEQYWSSRDDTYRFITVKEFADAFKLFHVGQKLGEELKTPFDKTKSHPAALTVTKYGIGKKELLKVCASRTYLLMKRNSFVYAFKIFQITIMSFITMTLFLRTNMHRDSVTEGGIYTSALFFAVSMMMFNGMAEIAMTVAKLPVFYKQRDLLFFPSWAYAIPNWILNIPISFLEVAVWVSTTYHVIGFDPDVGRFGKHYLLLLLVYQMSMGIYRMIAGVGRNMIVSYTCGCFALLILFVLGGFILSRDDIKKWWIWGYWASPMMYAQNAIIVNEFLGDSWSHVLPNTSEPLGILVMRARGFYTHAYWYWIGVGALIGYTIFFNFGFILALNYLNPFDKSHTFVSERKEEDDNNNCRTNTGVGASENDKRGMVLPFQPYSLTFDDITYSVDMPPEMKHEGMVEDRLVIVKSVSGAFRPGVLTALMGVSGAGKTTLMDVLAGRKTGGYIDGSITISGYPKKQETFARVSGYCEQNDIHSPYVTVYESLLYSAWLRLPPQVNAETRKMFVEQVMELVELNMLRQALVGCPGVNGLSTEQRKRLTIAVELVANPSIIFMDEPTSGLDARAAAIVMRTVRNTVDTGRTVVCTIHQPSIHIFEAFDELILLKRGGQEIYVGPLGPHSCHLIKYFEEIEGVSKIKNDYNPATWMLEVTSSSQELALGVDFAHLYKNSQLCRRNKALIQELSSPPLGSNDLYFPTMYSQPFLTQFKACLWKQHWSFWRNPSYTAVRLLFTVIIALMFGTLFWDLGSKTSKQQDLFNALGSMYAAVLFLGFQNGTSVQPVVSVERTVLYREKAAGMYSPMAYALAQIAIELPYVFVQAVVYGVVVYAMIGFEWTVAKFLWYILFMYLTLLYFTFYGMMCVALTPNYDVASIVCFACYALWNVFCGFLIPRPRIPVWWRWFYWACPMSWTLYGLVASQFGDVEDLVGGGDVSVKQFLSDYFGFEDGFVGVVAAVLVGVVVLFGFTFAMAINLFNFQKR